MMTAGPVAAKAIAQSRKALVLPHDFLFHVCLICPRMRPFAGQLRGPKEHDPLKRHVLFVCSRNQWRSPTAERVWQRHPELELRSAGTSESAKRRLRSADIHWADLILVMEDKHKKQIRRNFASELEDRPIYVLDIPDDYQFMQPELIEQLKTAVAPILGLD